MVENYIFVAILLFVIGIFGVILRKNIFTIFMSIELMLNAVALLFAIFARVNLNLDGQVIVMLVIAIAAAEASFGLALITLLHKSKQSLNIDSFKELKDEIGKWMYSIEWLLTHKAIIFKSNNIYFDLGLELEHLGFYSVDVQFEDTNQVSVECSFELLDGTPRHIAITGIQDKFMVYDKLIKLIKNYGGIKRIQKHSFFIFN